MFKKLSIIATILFVAIFAFQGVYAIDWVDSTTYYRIAGTTSSTSTGWAVDTVDAYHPYMYLIGIDVIDCNTTANVITIYDAKTYSDATLNNIVLGKVTYATASTYKNGEINNVVSGKFGDVGASFSYVYDVNRYLPIKNGIYIDSTDGPAYFTIRLIWRKP